MRKIALFIAVLSYSGLKGQQAILPSGHDANDTGGSISYSLGQIGYIEIGNIAGSLNPGVQQPIDFLMVGDKTKNLIEPSINIFPNPTTSTINLKIESQNFENLSFQLFGNKGELIRNQKILNSETNIPIGLIPSGNYFITVTDNKATIKTFKIIKN